MIPRVLVCIPVYHSVAPYPLFHFINLAQEAGKAEAEGRYKIRFLVGGPKVKTSNVRNEAAHTAIDYGCTHLLFMDDDMAPPAGMLQKLLDRDVDHISPLFFSSL